MGDEAISERVVEELQRRILNGQIPVGSWLRHSTIAEEFGVSRTPVREALRVLHAQGIVTIVRNRGARVNGHSGRDVRELGEVRAALEGLAAELAPRQDPAGDAVKQALRHATEEAARRGVFGVPTIEVDGRLFWGLDSLDMLAACLGGEPWFDGPQWDDAARVPLGVTFGRP